MIVSVQLATRVAGLNGRREQFELKKLGAADSVRKLASCVCNLDTYHANDMQHKELSDKSSCLARAVQPHDTDRSWRRVREKQQLRFSPDGRPAMVRCVPRHWARSAIRFPNLDRYRQMESST